ncbi:MAG: PilZ domain-containing protein [Myxococcota bacterium]
MQREDDFVLREPGLCSLRRPQQRAFPRVDAGCTVELRHNGSRFRARTRDVSPAGIFVRTIELIPVGDRVDMRVALDTESAPIELFGTVARTSPEVPGIAIQIPKHDQRHACAALGAFVVDLLGGTAAEMLTTTTDVGDDGEPSARRPATGWVLRDQLSRWQASLHERQIRLNNSTAALGKVRDTLRESHRRRELRAAEVEKVAAELDHRTARVAARERDVDIAAADFHRRAQDNEAAQHKLLEHARALRCERVEIVAREERLRSQGDHVSNLEARLTDTERQLQVHAFERTELTGQLHRVKEQRSALEDRLAETERRYRSEADTQRIVRPTLAQVYGHVPQHLESLHNTPTAVRSVDGRIRWMRFQARMRTGVRGVVQFLTSSW